jgi:hypothetical protein
MVEGAMRVAAQRAAECPEMAAVEVRVRAKLVGHVVEGWVEGA